MVSNIPSEQPCAVELEVDNEEPNDFMPRGSSEQPCEVEPDVDNEEPNDFMPRGPWAAALPEDADSGDRGPEPGKDPGDGGLELEEPIVQATTGADGLCGGICLVYVAEAAEPEERRWERVATKPDT